MKIPFVNLSREASIIEDELQSKTLEILKSGNYISGTNLKTFEESFSKFCGTPKSVGVGNGSDGLTLIMKSIGIGLGDEVICPTNSFIASAWSIIAAGAKPIFCDVEDDFLISKEKISSVLTKKTKAIIAVHLTGKLCNMNPILDLCKKHNIYLIEDAAQAIGAEDEFGRKAGSIGIASSFSLHPLKNLGVYGDGGIVTSQNEELLEKIKIMSNHGLINRDECIFWGYNTRLDELQAAYASIKLNYLDEWTKKYITIANFYSKNITNKVTKPRTRKGAKDVFHNYVLTVNPLVRDKLMKNLLEEGLETKIHYPIPIHLQKCSEELNYKKGDLPNSERLAKSMISLPIYPTLKEEELEFIVKTFNKIAAEII